MAVVVVLFLLGVNLWTFAQFSVDKRRAVAGVSRIPERNLLALSLIGGPPAAFAARCVFRHKTRKEPFSTQLAVSGTLQAGALAGWYAL